MQMSMGMHGSLEMQRLVVMRQLLVNPTILYLKIVGAVEDTSPGHAAIICGV